MELSDYVQNLRAELASVARVGSEDVARAGELLADTLDSAVRLTLLDVLSGAAAEITSKLDQAMVEVHLSSGGPTFAVVQTPPEHVAQGHVEAEEESGTSRVTLRLPDGLKSRAEAAAARDGVSLNTWLVRAASRALDDPRGSQSSSRRGPGRRISGFAVS
jgi:homoserine kinase